MSDAFHELSALVDVFFFHERRASPCKSKELIMLGNSRKFTTRSKVKEGRRFLRVEGIAAETAQKDTERSVLGLMRKERHSFLCADNYTSERSGSRNILCFV